MIIKDEKLREAFLRIQRRAVELDKFKRKELDQKALAFGIDTTPYRNTMWGYDKDVDYSSITKLEVIFTIIEEEFKKQEGPE